MFMRLLNFFAFLLVSSHVTAANQNTLTPHQQIEQGAKDYLSGFYAETQNVSINVGKVDERIPVRPCSTPLQYQIPGNGVPSYVTTIKVSCPDNNWYLFVKARINQTLSAVIAVNSLHKGSTISLDDLAVVEMQASQLRGNFYSDPQEIVGTKVKRFIRANARVAAADICVICKGDHVSLAAVNGRLKVSTTGTALTDGMIGEMIRVQNNRSERIVSARVKAIGMTELSL
jgi:flagella basal body P-ring formation protein FlgA